MTARPRLVHSYKDYFPPVIGGMEQHMAAVCAHFADTYDVTALVCSRSLRGQERRDGQVRVIETPSLGRLRSAPLPLGYGRRLRELRPDLIHFHMPNPTCEFAALRARPTGRVVATYQSDIVRQRVLNKLYAPFQRRFLDWCDVVIATTPHYIDTSPVLQRVRHKIRLIPNGIDTCWFAELPAEDAPAVEAARARYGDAFLLFVGRLRYYKGLPVLLDALPDISDAQLVIAGTGTEEQALRAQTARLGLDTRVHFLGDVAARDLRVLYHACGVFVLPAIARSEAYGLVQLEAHSAGTPVISTALRTGVDYVNAHEVSGLIVPPGDARALGAAVRRLLDDAEYRAELGAAAQARAHREFNERVMFERLAALYRELLER